MTTLGLIRHGVTNWNDEYRTQGHSDIPLNKKGRQQAELLSRRIGTEHWDYIYSSDLSRALETAEIIGKINNIDVRTDPRLREMNCGLIEGTTEQERVNRWGYGWFKQDLGIESNDDIVKRGRQCLADISDRHPDQNILIVSHGAFLGMILKRLIPHIDMTESLSNTSITMLHTSERSRWDCSVYNCTKHLNMDSFETERKDVDDEV